MDDLIQDNQSKYTPSQAVTLKEMSRMSQDRIRVANPTDKDFIVYWDSMGFRIPARTTDLGHGFGQQILPRYIAINYVIKMKEKLVGEKIIAAVVQENEARKQRGAEEMNHYQDRLRFESQKKQDLKDFDKKLESILWLGVEEEYGMELIDELAPIQRERPQDEVLANLNYPARKLDKAPSLDDLNTSTPATSFANVDAVGVVQDKPSLPVEPSIESKKDDLVSELSG